MAYGLLTPGDPLGPRYHLFPEEDKLLHAALFFTETVLALLVFRIEWPLRRMTGFLLVGIVGLLAAAGTELIQGQVAYRSADIRDFAADVVGIFLGFVFFLVLEKRNQTLLN